MNLIKKITLFLVLLLPSTLYAEARLENLATRGFIGTGDEVMIGGLVITGDSPKTILIRARGPALALAGVEGAISDPEMFLFSGAVVIDSNNDWEDHDNASQVPLSLQPADFREAVIVRTLDPGAYTAIVAGVNNEQGIGLVEIFELSNTGITKLQNIATRGFVGVGDAVMIGGLVITGDENKTLIIRAKGPSLTDQGVSGALANPELILLSGSEVIDSNTDWQNHSRASEIPTELRPTDNLEAVVLTELAPGAYTAIVTGTGGTTGVGIVEVFEIDNLDPPAQPDAQAFFSENIETSVIQSRCIVCHVSNGVASNTNLIFERTAANSDIANFQQFEGFVGTSLSAQALVLSKVSGTNHVGGNQLPIGSAGYNDLESFLNILTSTDSSPSAQPEFFAAVRNQPRASTLRKAAITLAGRLPTEAELAQITDDASLRVGLRSLMQGDAFHEYLLDAANDRLLIRGVLDPSFLDDCLECFPVFTNHLYSLASASATEERDDEIQAFRFRGQIGLLESPLELVAYVAENDRPYSEILTANYMMLNPTSNFSVEGTATFDDIDDVYEFKPGVMTGYYRPGPGTIVEEDEDSELFQVIDPGDLSTNFPHSGILTTQAFLSRYPTTATNRNRARARWTFLNFLDIDIEKSASRTNDPAALADTNNPTLNNENCTVCHTTMDPVAGSFQNYDETGLYKSNFGGQDSLDNFYKFRGEGESLYQEGDTWYADMVAPGVFSQLAPDADNSLQWLSQRITEDPGFPRAAVKFWWPSLMGKETLLAPEVVTDNNYDAKLVAFNAQSQSIQALAEQFSQNGMLLKDLLVEMMMTSWFRAESVISVDLTETTQLAHEISDLGNEVLLTPERLQLKTKAVTGFNWRTYDTDIEGQQTGLGQTYNLYYGGIDSSAITKRATELTPLMSTVAMSHALESACPIVLREFILDDGSRKLFNNIDGLVTPLTVGSSTIEIPSNTSAQFTNQNFVVDIPAGANTVEVSVLDGYCDFDQENEVCLSQNHLRVNEISVRTDGESTATQIDIETITIDQNCGGLGNNAIALYGQCTLSFTLNVEENASYTITVSMAGVKDGVDHVNTDNILSSIGVASQAPAASAQTAGASLIKQKLIDLHQAMLGKTYSVNSEEIAIAYQLFVDSWLGRQSDTQEGNLLNESEACEWYSDTDFTNELGLQQEDENFYNDLYQSADDLNHSKQAWVTVITYLMTHYHYLHE